MRRKPSASHCVKKPPPEVYRPDSWVFFSGAQVLRISSVKSPSGGLSMTSSPASLRNDTLCPLASTRSGSRSSPCRRSGPPVPAALRTTAMRLATMVRTGSRSKVSSTLRIQ